MLKVDLTGCNTVFNAVSLEQCAQMSARCWRVIELVVALSSMPYLWNSLAKFLQDAGGFARLLNWILHPRASRHDVGVSCPESRQHKGRDDKNSRSPPPPYVLCSHLHDSSPNPKQNTSRRPRKQRVTFFHPPNQPTSRTRIVCIRPRWNLSGYDKLLRGENNKMMQ